MKKLFTALMAAALTGWGILSAATTGDYLFKLQIDESVRDMSGNNRHPLNNFGESQWYQGELEGVCFKNDKDAIGLPASAFAYPKGKVEMIVRADRLTPDQLILRHYSKGDGFLIELRKGQLRAAFYHRKTKTWRDVRAKKSMFSERKWVKITVTYTLPGEMNLYVDGVHAGKCALDFPFEPDKKAKLILGNNQVGACVFRNGVIHRVTFSDTPTPPAQSEVKAAAAPVKMRSFTLGNSTLSFPETGAFALTSWKHGGVEFVAPACREPLWKLDVYNRKTRKTERIDAGDVAPKVTAVKDGLEIRWKDLKLSTGEKFSVTAHVKAVDPDTLHWTAEISEVAAPWTIDTFHYPVIACAPTSADPKKMFLAYPAYYGRNKVDPFTFGKPQPGARFGNFYPAGAHMQFCYLYGEDRPGIFFMTPDAQGNCKDFLFSAQPDDKALVFHLSQFAKQRQISRSFSSAYPVETGIMAGDWYDAAKRYRRWAIKQHWCAQGTLAKRTDLPKWAKELDLALRPATEVRDKTFTRKEAEDKVGMVRESNQVIRKMLPGKFLQVWYGYHYPKSADRSTGFNREKHVCPFNGWWEDEPVKGVPELISEFKPQGFYTIGYLNSRIYDQSRTPGDPETKSIQPSVMLDVNGKYQLYQKVLYDVCRHDPRWQDHLLKVIKRDAAALGFSGMYMDSFGRGQQFCWATNHGHLPGDSCAAVAGQLAMANKIRTEMRKIDPEFVLSSEASTEPFVGVIDLKLHHYNLHLDGIPLWPAVYHDYQLVYGRTATTPRHHTAAMFHLGGILGRVFTSQPGMMKTYFPGEIPGFYRQLLALRREFRDRIGLGEMLRPPVVDCAVPPEKGMHNRSAYTAPVVFSSAWRNEAGDVALFFTNSTEKPVEFEFALKGAEFDPIRKNQWTLVVPDGEGKLSRRPWEGGKYTLPPLGSIAVDCGKLQ